MVKTPPPTGLTALARAAARTSGSKSTTTTATSRSSSAESSDEEINRHFDYNDIDNDDDDPVEEVAAPKAKALHPVVVATLADVVVAKEEEGEPLSLVQKEVTGQKTYYTRIRSIAGYNITGLPPSWPDAAILRRELAKSWARAT